MSINSLGASFARAYAAAPALAASPRSVGSSRSGNRGPATFQAHTYGAPTRVPWEKLKLDRETGKYTLEDVDVLDVLTEDPYAVVRETPEGTPPPTAPSAAAPS